jgi:hypothetical protein
MLSCNYSYLICITNIIKFFTIRNIREKAEIPAEIKSMMYSIPYLETKVEVLDIFEKIRSSQNKRAIGM